MSNYCSTVIGLYIHWQRLIDQFEHKVNVHKYDPLWRHGDSTIELSNRNFTTSCSRHPVSCVAMEDIWLISDTHWFLVMGLCLLLYTWANPEGCIENNQRNYLPNIYVSIITFFISYSADMSTELGWMWDVSTTFSCRQHYLFVSLLQTSKCSFLENSCQ